MTNPRLHVHITPNQRDHLQRLADTRETTVATVVREIIAESMQPRIGGASAVAILDGVVRERASAMVAG